MKLAIMQPYFLPYIGYFQLMGAVDAFVIYDNIKYTKKGWINRNRLLRNGEPALFSLPLAKDSDHLDVRERRLSLSFDRPKLLNQLIEAYRHAPQFPSLRPSLERMVSYPDNHLFPYLLNAIEQVREQLALPTRLITSSDVPADHELRGQDRVLAICKALGATCYVNPTGGTDLYQQDAFARQGVELRFLRSTLPPYEQGKHPFVPALSIIDVLMFNTPDAVQRMLREGFEFH